MDKLRIEGVPGSMGSRFKVFVGKVELKAVMSVNLYLRHGEPGECQLIVDMDGIEVDGEFMTYLEGHIK